MFLISFLPHSMRFGFSVGLAPKPSEEALQRDPIRRWRDAYSSMTYDGLANSSLWKCEFINGRTQPPLITPYFSLCRPLLDEWRQAISLASTQSTTLSHDEICDIVTRGLSTTSEQLAQIPSPAPPSAPEPTAALSSPPASTPQPVAAVVLPPTAPPSVPVSATTAAS